MKKRVVSKGMALILALVFAFSLLPVAAFAGDVEMHMQEGSTADHTGAHIVIIDNDSDPVVGVEVEVFVKPAPDQTKVLGSGTTNLLGAAEFAISTDGLEPGEYQLYVNASIEGYVPISEAELTGCTITVTGPVCKVGTVEYESVRAALFAIGAGAGTITMIADSAENVTIPEGADITLDLNGFVLKAASAGSVIVNYGTLTVTDGDPEAVHYFNYSTTGAWTLDTAATTGIAIPDITSETWTGEVIKVYGGVITGGTGSKIHGVLCGGGVGNRGTLTLNGGSIVGCSAKDWGGGIYSDGTLTVSGGTIAGCSAPAGQGGGVYVNTNGEMTLSGGSIACCTALTGGGIDSYGSLILTGGSMVGNSANNHGGGINNNGTLTVEDGTIAGCVATGGGGIYNAGTLTVSGGSITGCSAPDGCGGGVYVNTDEGTTTMSGGTVTGCSADYYGGGVYVLNDALTLSGVTITACSADKGGGVYVLNGALTLSGVTITACSADKGGGVYVDTGSEMTMTGGTIAKNNAAGPNAFGGGVYVYTDGKAAMTGGSIVDCSSESSGGGVYVFKGILTLSAGTISGCSAAKNGGGVVVSSGTMAMSAGTITGCGADERGGGVHVSKGTMTMTGGTVTDCNADYNGGGIYVDTAKNTVLNLSGSPVVTGNTRGGESADNVFLAVYEDLGANVCRVFAISDGDHTTPNDALTDGARIGVRTAAAPLTISSNGTNAARAYITADDDAHYVVYSAADACLKLIPRTVCVIGETGYDSIGEALEDAHDGERADAPTVIEMSGDANENVTIGSGRFIVLDMNGRTLSAKDPGSAVTVSGTLTVRGTGSITGSVCADPDATGGVCVSESGTFGVSGKVVIAGNYSCGGTGDHIHTGSCSSADVYLASGKTIAVGAALEAGTSIGIRTAVLPTADAPVTLTDGYSLACGDKNPADYFFSNDPAYVIRWNDAHTEAILAVSAGIRDASVETESGDLICTVENLWDNAPVEVIAVSYDAATGRMKTVDLRSLSDAEIDADTCAVVRFEGFCSATGEVYCLYLLNTALQRPCCAARELSKE